MKQTYSHLRSKLDNVMTALQDPGVDIDKAIKLHEEATEILKQLEAYLKDAELKVKKAIKS